MSEIQKYDKNFQQGGGGGGKVNKPDLRFYDALQPPFSLHGVYYDEADGRFRRMPGEVAATVSPGVAHLHRNTAGGRLRFRSNCRYVAIHAEMDHIDRMAHFPLTGSAGFDLYGKREGGREEYLGTFVPPLDMTDGYEECIAFWPRNVIPRTRETVEFTLHFPLYSCVKRLWIGLPEEAELLPAAPYRVERPVVYYGSSITQGGCASHPGAAYPAILSRRLGCDHVNLGFSGSAKGEEEIGRYLAGLDMSAFVYDYDHNAPTVEHLRKTHERLFLQIREKHPTLPVLMMTAVSLPRCFDDRAARRDVIFTTYQNALARGDRSVYFLDGGELFARYGNEGTVEGCHPNDLGFLHMAEAVEPLLAEMLKG